MERVRQAESGAGEGEKERELAKAALSVAELGRFPPMLHRLLSDVLLHPKAASEEDEASVDVLPLLSLDFVKAHAPTVDKARDTVIQEMESMVMTGLADLVRWPHGSSLTPEPNAAVVLFADSSQPPTTTRACIESPSRLERRRYFTYIESV